jgi:transcriptional regulator with PAS, ATPase and Fis domain
MKSILICWLGFADLKASVGNKKSGLGPIGQGAAAISFDEIILISDHLKPENTKYVKWLKSKTESKVFLHTVKLSGPTNFGEIYESAVNVVDNTKKKNDKNISLTFHLSPGTPTMAAVWIIIAKTRSPAQLIESSVHEGVKIASVPFDISADFIPDLLRKPDDRLEQLAAELPPQAPEFSDIIHRSQVMKRVIVKARHFAPRSVPVLIEGETGTGKELFARAIHNASPRSLMPFVTVNCGAIPSELIESELFGHEKGAFTGADKQRKGYFEDANEGTLFLDEIGELPLSMQVKLLRVLQEKEVTRIGSTRPIKFNIRIIAATNKNLINEVASERFRSDLFYRIVVSVLKLPPLRERSGDISLLIDTLLTQINIDSAEEPGYKHKKISAKAKNIMLQHSWPGNVRELINTLRRAAIWSPGTTIGDEDIIEALFLPITPNEDELLNRPLGDSLNLSELMKSLAQHYLRRALDEAHGNKTKAAALVGLPSYQTLTNWMKKYKVE